MAIALPPSTTIITSSQFHLNAAHLSQQLTVTCVNLRAAARLVAVKAKGSHRKYHSRANCWLGAKFCTRAKVKWSLNRDTSGKVTRNRFAVRLWLRERVCEKECCASRLWLSYLLRLCGINGSFCNRQKSLLLFFCEYALMLYFLAFALV